MEHTWNLDQVESLTGKVAIVTGGNAGIGFEVAKVLALKGATVVLGCRSLERGKEAKARILAEYETADVAVIPLDLADLSSVKTFAETFLARYQRLDTLLNNAGIANYLTYGKTVAGIEQHMAVNFLGPFALTGLLFELLKSTPEARIVNISSMAHKYAMIDWEALLYDETVPLATLYGSSKLGNLFFTYELDRRLRCAGLDLKVLAAHPGISDTSINQNLDENTLSFIAPHLQPASQGALPGLRAALDGDAQSGQFFGPDGDNEFSGQPILRDSSPLSHDEEMAKAFFDQAEKLTGVVFQF